MQKSVAVAALLAVAGLLQLNAVTATYPRSTESRSAESRSAEPRSTEPRSSEPRSSEPRSSESSSSVPRSSESRKGLMDLERSCMRPATYTVLNSCDWNPEFHPVDFPEMAHWSPLCGGAHSDKVSIVKLGENASEGVRIVAEMASCDVINETFRTCNMWGVCGVPQKYECDKFSGKCDHKGSVEVTKEYPYVSFVSMIAPSPDWFSAVGSIPLCEDGQWIESFERELAAYDAGTDDGVTFLSENKPREERVPISRFEALDSSNIFYNSEREMLYPLCKITLVLDN